MRPIQIKRLQEANSLRFTWDNGKVSVFPIPFLRQECPCAACKGEVLFGKVYKPAPLSIFQEGMYDLKELRPVGQYAVQAVWGDGHDTGIYSWEYLLQLEEELSAQGS
jgi:DUF971 family protein